MVVIVMVKIVFVSVLLAACTFPPPAEAQQCQNSRPAVQRSCSNISTIDCGHLYSLSRFPNNITESFETSVLFFVSYSSAYFQCSDYLQAHLCLVLFPVCQDTAPGASRFLLPCRSLCRQVQRDCSSQLQPSTDPQCLLSDCDRYPDTECIGIDSQIVRASLGLANPADLDSNNTCPQDNLAFFSDNAKNFAKGWVAFWSALCYVSTLITLLTYLIDTSRFQYPWRPVVYLAAAFHIHTLGYFLALIIGRSSVTCPDGDYVETGDGWTWLHTPCILVFFLLYYSTMAAFLWWLILTLSWFLSSALKWGNESIRRLALFYHATAWLLPLVLTVCLLATRVVSTDELTATCFVVRTDSQASYLALLLGLILPLSLILLTGVVFIAVGFVNLLQIRQFLIHRGKERESIILEKLMIRIGIYVAVYIIPAAILISCFVYEIESRPKWATVSESCDDCPRPSSAVFMLRVLLFLLMGTLTGAWIWSRKTLESWRRLPAKIRDWLFPENDNFRPPSGPVNAHLPASSTGIPMRANSFSSRQHPALSPSYLYSHSQSQSDS